MKAVVLIALLGVVKSAPAEGPKAQVLEAMQASLPIDLVATDVEIVGKDDWSKGAKLAISWERGTRPGRRRATLFVTDGEDAYKAWAYARLVTLKKVLVVKRDVATGETLGFGDVQLELRPVPRSAVLDLSAEALVGQAALRDLVAGEVLGKRDVALPRPVPRGTPVTVVSASGGARIEVAGTLIESVRLGGLGRARTASSRRALRGRLVAPDRFVLEVSR